MEGFLYSPLEVVLDDTVGKSSTWFVPYEAAADGDRSKVIGGSEGGVFWLDVDVVGGRPTKREDGWEQRGEP